MKTDKSTKLARRLAYDWARVELPNQRLTYLDYLRTIVDLATSIDNA